ncbi:MAG: Uma2 family endonuclease [Solirubrobacteraceae bacterium]
MAASATATAATAEPHTQLPLYRLDIETYNRIVASGALEGERVELLDGVLVQMSPQSPAHSVVVTKLMRHFAAIPSWWAQVQMPLEVHPASEPEPDLAVYAQAPPPGQHHRTALLVVEVAVSSQLIDRNVKTAKYASAAVPTYWLIDVPSRTVEVYTDPTENGYRRCERLGLETTLPCALEGVPDIDLRCLFEGVET